MIGKSLERETTIEPLSTWLEQAETTGNREGCETAIEQAIVLFEQAYAYLPFIRRRGFDPVERLRLLRSRLQQTRRDFFGELLSVFAEIGDRHTSCYLPEPYAEKIAFLPFLVREFFEEDERRLCVVASATDELRRGDMLLSWDDAPLAETLARHMTLQLGANQEARRAKAVQTLTFRPLASLPPPTGDVLLEAISPEGRRRKVRLAWQVAEAARLTHYFPPPPGENDRQLTDNIRVRLLETSYGTFGVIRITSFQEHPDSFMRSFLTALEVIPSDGLVLDMRGCEEGVIPAAERLLQLFTPERIEPQPFQFRVTELVRRIVNQSPALLEWRDPVERAARRGESFSEWRPLTSAQEANAVGQRYSGPVVLLLDALTFSSAEMFAAGFQDHCIGPVLGVAPSTGGGGASAWHQSLIFKLSEDEALRPLAHAPVFRVAVRRCERVRAMTGQALEGVGLRPDALHLPTRRDLLEEDADLFARAAKILAEIRNRRYS